MTGDEFLGRGAQLCLSQLKLKRAIVEAEKSGLTAFSPRMSDLIQARDRVAERLASLTEEFVRNGERRRAEPESNPNQALAVKGKPLFQCPLPYGAPNLSLKVRSAIPSYTRFVAGRKWWVVRDACVNPKASGSLSAKISGSTADDCRSTGHKTRAKATAY